MDKTWVYIFIIQRESVTKKITNNSVTEFPKNVDINNSKSKLIDYLYQKNRLKTTIFQNNSGNLNDSIIDKGQNTNEINKKYYHKNSLSTENLLWRQI